MPVWRVSCSGEPLAPRWVPLPSTELLPFPGKAVRRGHQCGFGFPPPHRSLLHGEICSEFYGHLEELEKMI